jgi:hypothetical protein
VVIWCRWNTSICTFLCMYISTHCVKRVKIKATGLSCIYVLYHIIFSAEPFRELVKFEITNELHEADVFLRSWWWSAGIQIIRPLQTPNFIIVSTGFLHWTAPWAKRMQLTSSHSFVLWSFFKNILQSTTVYCKLSLPFRISDQYFTNIHFSSPWMLHVTPTYKM